MHQGKHKSCLFLLFVGSKIKCNFSRKREEVKDRTDVPCFRDDFISNLVPWNIFKASVIKEAS